MGTYSDNQRFYLVEGTELVNVDQDWNYNLERADEKVKPLLEYYKTDIQSISNSSLPKSRGYKWYKTYSNSIWVYTNPGSGLNLYQDPNADIATWNLTGFSFNSGYGSMNLEESRIAYTIDDGWVRWRGRLMLNDGSSDLPLNTVVDFMSIDNSILPDNSKYFFVHGGNASSTYQVARIWVASNTSSNPRMEFVKYGGSATNLGERYISLNEVQYPLSET